MGEDMFIWFIVAVILAAPFIYACAAAGWVGFLVTLIWYGATWYIDGPGPGKMIALLLITAALWIAALRYFRNKPWKS